MAFFSAAIRRDSIIFIIIVIIIKFLCCDFNGITTFLGYLMPNLSLLKDSFGTI